jgi:hypothetical protein
MKRRELCVMIFGSVIALPAIALAQGYREERREERREHCERLFAEERELRERRERERYPEERERTEHRLREVREEVERDCREYERRP